MEPQNKLANYCVTQALSLRKKNDTGFSWYSFKKKTEFLVEDRRGCRRCRRLYCCHHQLNMCIVAVRKQILYISAYKYNWEWVNFFFTNTIRLYDIYLNNFHMPVRNIHMLKYACVREYAIPNFKIGTQDREKKNWWRHIVRNAWLTNA